MKKNYKNPTVKVFKIETKHMIAASLRTNNNELTGTYSGNSRSSRFSSWEESEDE